MLRFRIRKKYFLGALLPAVLVAGVVTWFVHSGGPRRTETRNVLLISIDTCRADTLSCYGHARRITPNIDALARDGVLFTHAQSTNPITLPAHCSMLTGTIPPFHGVHLNQGNTLDDSHVTLAEIVQKHGYQTGAVIGAFPLHSTFGLDQGFDTYDEEFRRQEGKYFFHERDAQEVTGAANGWLEQHHDKPFFLFVHYFDPHQPYEPPERFAGLSSREKYAGEIAYTDFCIGQLVDKLKMLDLFDSTLIIITSDHGESLREHNEDTHAFFIYQSTIRVPLIIKAPGCVAGHKVLNAVSLIDIVPTVLSLLGLSVPPQVQGIDLSGYLGGRGEPADDRFLYSESWTPTKFDCCPLRGLVHGKWRYIWSVRPEVYDLIGDPAETKNLVQEEEKISKLLHSRLEEIVARQGQSAGERTSVVPDRETVRRLESLGYVGGHVVDAALEIDRHMEDPKDSIDIFQRFIAARTALGEKRLDEAKAQCLEILAKRRRLLPVYSLLGTIAFEQGAMADAIHHYSEVLVIVANAKDPQVFTNEVYSTLTARGLAFQKSGKYELAIADYGNAIPLKPDYARPYTGRGIAYAQLGNYDLATRNFAKAIELEPDYAEPYYKRGLVYTQLGNYNLAVRDFAKVIELAPDHAKIYYLQGVVHAQLGHYDLALGDFARAIELEPGDAEPYHRRGLLYAELGTYELAISDHTKAIELKPDYAEAYSGRAIAQAQSGTYDLAVRDFARSIELKPQDEQAHNNLAWLLATCPDPKFRDAEKAVSHAKRAHELLGGDDFGMLDTLAAACAASGQFVEAVRWQTKAVAIAPAGAMVDAQSRLELYQVGKPYRDEEKK